MELNGPLPRERHRARHSRAPVRPQRDGCARARSPYSPGFRPPCLIAATSWPHHPAVRAVGPLLYDDYFFPPCRRAMSESRHRTMLFLLSSNAIAAALSAPSALSGIGGAWSLASSTAAVDRLWSRGGAAAAVQRYFAAVQRWCASTTVQAGGKLREIGTNGPCTAAEDKLLGPESFLLGEQTQLAYRDALARQARHPVCPSARHVEQLSARSEFNSYRPRTIAAPRRIFGTSGGCR